MNDERPLPPITPLNRPFWEAAARGKLVLPACRGCGKVFYPIAPVCPACASGEIGWRRACGRGTVSSFVVFHQAFFPAFRDRLPYAVVQVELEEGPRYNANLLDMDPADIRIGMPVEVTFERVTEEITLPQFRPARDQGSEIRDQVA